MPAVQADSSADPGGASAASDASSKSLAGCFSFFVQLLPEIIYIYQKYALILMRTETVAATAGGVVSVCVGGGGLIDPPVAVGKLPGEQGFILG